MKRLSKILVVIAVLCALGYAFRRFQSCQIVGANLEMTTGTSRASAPVVKPADALTLGARLLVYPSPSALASMKLGYDVMRTNADGSVMVLPLPPGSALQTTLVLPIAGHHNLSVREVDDKCASSVKVNFYRLDRDSPVLTGSIFPSVKNAPLIVDIEKVKLSDPFIVTVELAPGARNNWFCNVALSWDSIK